MPQAQGPGTREAATREAATRIGYIQVLAAVTLFSTSPVLIRWAGDVSAVEVTFWRLALAALTVGVVGALMAQPVRWRALPRRRFAGYGVVIALHFFLYIASLSFTSVAHALALVYTAPLFIAVFSQLFLAERLSGRRWLGVLLGVLGVAVLAGFEPLTAAPPEPEGDSPTLRSTMLLGDSLAVGSAVAFAVYSVIGRAQRRSHRLFDYAAGVYGWGALWLLPLALWQAPASRYDLPGALTIVALGVGPLGIGHTLYNAALRRVPATFVNLIATLEVVGGVALSAALLGELPSVVSLTGGAIVLVGILLVVL